MIRTKRCWDEINMLKFSVPTQVQPGWEYQTKVSSGKVNKPDWPLMNTATFLSLIFIVYSPLKLVKDKGPKGQFFKVEKYILYTAIEEDKPAEETTNKACPLSLYYSGILWMNAHPFTCCLPSTPCFLLYLVSVPLSCPGLIFKSLASPLSRNNSVPVFLLSFFFSFPPLLRAGFPTQGTRVATRINSLKP